MTTTQAMELVAGFTMVGASRGVKVYVALSDWGSGAHERMFFAGKTGTHSISVENSNADRARAHFDGFLEAN